MLNIFGYKIKTTHILIAIIGIGAILRFWGLGSAEIFHDEGFYAFRSLGNLDYIQNDDQTTPIQWYKDGVLPWWTELSFHDHPKLYFLISSVFFRIFGESLFVARLPSALSGIFSIFLLYLVVRKILEIHKGNNLNPENIEFLSLLSALILAVNHIHIWVSRSALMESVQIAAILINIWLFFVFLENRNKWHWFGISLGACFLAKYTSAFLLPVYFIYLFIFNRKILNSRQLYSSLLVALLLITPIIIYNFYLYTTLGHFDLQFAFLFGQDTPEWRASLGKIQDPFSDFGVNMIAMYSIPFLLLSMFGFVLSFVGTSTYLSNNSSTLSFLGFSVVVLIIMLSGVGSAYRFLALLSPFLAILTVIALIEIGKYVGKKETFYLIILFFCLYEIYFSVDGVFLTFPDFGVVKLDNYLEQVFEGRRSLNPPESSNPHLQNIINSNLYRYPASEQPFLVVYDENIGLSARLWVFTRRIFYNGIRVVTTGQFRGILRNNGPESLSGYRIYFVKTYPYTSLNSKLSIPDASELESFLTGQLNLVPAKRITGYQNLPMFDIYDFTM